MDDHPIKLFGDTVATLNRSLDLRARRHEMILGNVANADTPGYRPFSMDVEKALQDNETGSRTETLVQTDPRHLTGNTVSDDLVEEDTETENPLLFRGDGNGVDIDTEMTALAKNSLLYKASSQIVGAKFKQLKTAITGGTR